MFFEPGDCIDIKKITIGFDGSIKLPNILNANKAIVQFVANKNDFYPDFDLYDSVVSEPIGVISESENNPAYQPLYNGIYMNQFGLYEIIGKKNIDNTTVQNLLPDSFNLYLKVIYYK